MTEVTTNLTSLIAVAKSILGLLSEFPLNIIVVGTVAGVAFKLIKGAKRVAR